VDSALIPSPSGLPEIDHQSELLFNLSENDSRDGLQGANESPVVDRSTLINHDFAVLAVSGDTLWKRNAEDTFSGQSSRARQNPGGRVLHLVQQVSLNDQNGLGLPGFDPRARIEIGKVERPAPDSH
jgi:hypothetical protein